METLIAYVCVAADHQAGQAGPDKLTVHEGRWAYCPFDARGNGHEWKLTGGVKLADLALRGTMPRGAEQTKEP